MKPPLPLRGPGVVMIPPGDERERLVCPDCGCVAYRNPPVVVGSVSTWEDRILMCRRAIEPSRGLWTLPAGCMEEGESTAEGAAREAWEEACARLSSVTEEAGVPKAEAMIRQLVEGHETVARAAREVFAVAEKGGDQSTLDTLPQRLQVHEKTAWMLRSLLG